jgi:hypothetical protein
MLARSFTLAISRFLWVASADYLFALPFRFAFATCSGHSTRRMQSQNRRRIDQNRLNSRQGLPAIASAIRLRFAGPST